jgi:hypothetical protein
MTIHVNAHRNAAEFPHANAQMHMQLRTGLDGAIHRVTLPLRAPKLGFLSGARSALQLQLLRLHRRRRCLAHALRRVLADPSDGLLVQDTFADTTMHSPAQAFPNFP